MDKNKANKLVSWVGDSKERVSAFPNKVRIDAGYQLWRLQQGLQPNVWKSLDTVGQGAQEIILRDEDGWYRVIYVAKFEEAIYVLHAFQKKTNQTSKNDVNEAERAYRAVVRQRESK